jgi:hypothetical protein
MSALAFWFLQIPGWLLFVYLVIAQCLPVFSYELGVRMGTQEPAAHVTDVGVAFWKGFAGADLVIYAPLLGGGLVGHAFGMEWGRLVLGAALGISAYWPIVCLWAVYAAHGKPGWTLPNEQQYWIALPVISLWSICGIVALLVW